MKNLLKLASAVALSCTFLVAHAQQGNGKMMKKDEKVAAGKVADGKMKVKMHDGNVTHKAKTDRDGKMMSKDKM